jgi:hypothetical protein
MEGEIQHNLCKEDERTDCNNYLVVILSPTNTELLNTLPSRLNPRAVTQCRKSESREKFSPIEARPVNKHFVTFIMCQSCMTRDS